jgi:hypothetical protein
MVYGDQIAIGGATYHSVPSISNTTPFSFGASDEVPFKLSFNGAKRRTDGVEAILLKRCRI